MTLDRRTFLHSSLALPALAARGAADKPNKKIVLDVVRWLLDLDAPKRVVLSARRGTTQAAGTTRYEV